MKRQLRLLRGRKLESPHGLQVRPTSSLVREALMNILRESIENSTWLDLYSGSGIIGCEAIEGGAATVVAIELNKKNYKTCLANLSNTANTNQRNISLEVINAEVNKFLSAGYKEFLEKTSSKGNSYKQGFDFIYIDPPYKMKSYDSVLKNLLLGNWTMQESLAICEFSIEEGIDIPSTWTIKHQKTYGQTGLIFLTPSLA